MKLVQSILDRVASPAKASIGLAGGTAAQFGGHLGEEQSALVSGRRLAPDRIKASKRSTESSITVALSGGETVIDRPIISHHLGRAG